MSTPPSNAAERSAEWLLPPSSEEGLRRVIETIRERFVLILVVVGLTTAAAVIYVTTASKVYTARAELLISPVPSGDTATVGLGLLRESPDPTRDVETAARVVTTPEVATRVKAKLRSHRSLQSLLNHVSAEPVAQANIVAVSANESTPRSAQLLANAFADAAVAERTARLHNQLRSLIARLRASGRTNPLSPASGPGSAASQLAQYETLLQSDDPTLRVEARAQQPTSPSSPRKALSVAAGLFAGLVLGLGGAFGMQLLDPRLRRDEQLRAGYRLPVLARVPTQRTRRVRVLLPEQLSLPVAEAFRGLRAALITAGNEESGGNHQPVKKTDSRVVERPSLTHDSRTILVTGPGSLEGKTTTALNLASGLAELGHKVVLVEADLQRPSLGKALNLNDQPGIESVLDGKVDVSGALVTPTQLGPHLKLLVAKQDSAGAQELFATARTEVILHELKRLADWVIIDCPPINLVADTLPITRLVDDVVLVVRLRRTRLRQLAGLSERLAQAGVEPTGFVVLGDDEFTKEYGYY